MFLEMLVLNKPEEIIRHGFSCALAQCHMVGICLVAIIVLFQSLLLIYGVVCTFAHGRASVISTSSVANIILGAFCIVANVFCGANGVLFSNTC